MSGNQMRLNLDKLPWNCRPVSPADPNDGEVDEWEDNWLSNSFAWASNVFTPSYCQTPEHWTSKLLHYLWTSCPCCLGFRFLVIGTVGGLAIGSVLTYIALTFTN